MEKGPTTQSAYMLIFRNTGPDVFQRLSPEERQGLVTRWNAWFDGLVAEGKAVEGQPLELETRVVSGPGGARVTDGPFPETKEAIGGYVVLMVDSVDEATAIARRHPGLENEMIIEIRELSSDCPLGGINIRSRLTHRIS